MVDLVETTREREREREREKERERIFGEDVNGAVRRPTEVKALLENSASG